MGIYAGASLNTVVAVPSAPRGDLGVAAALRERESKGMGGLGGTFPSTIERTRHIALGSLGKEVGSLAMFAAIRRASSRVK